MPETSLSGIPELICAYAWREGCEYALGVFSCESGPDYIDGNLYDDYAGLAQISLRWHSWRFHADPYEPAENVRVAFEIYSEQGWTPWECVR